MIAYQSTDFNQQRDSQHHPKSDYVDQSMVSLSALGGGLGGGLPSNSLSVMSKSVERVSGSAGVADTSLASAQSALQRKLRLKTSKQYKVITERGNSTAGKIKPRPASSLATTAGVKNN